MKEKETYISTENLPVAMTVAQLAQVLDIGTSSAYNLVKSGNIRSVRIGHQIRIPKIELLRYLGHDV